MAEIKSTLELVMERTQHLHMTEEDKRRQADEEFTEAVCRLVSKRLDGQIGMDRFKTELNRLSEMDGACKMRAAVEILRRIDPLTDSSPLLDLMEHGLGLDISSIEAALKQFGERLHSEQDRAVERTRADLFKKGVSGGAVIPNVEADAEWQEKRRQMLETVKEELAPDLVRGRAETRYWP